LSNCALNRIPVYNAIQLKEALTGKVNVKHLIANNFGDLSPSLFHQNFKRFIDVAFLLLISPIVIPVMVILAIWISSDSPGGPFFMQPRMSLGGKWFNVIKFRSMYVNHDGKHFTEEVEDHRITKVGKIIRKYRLDELPQFWNVLKGEMSLIGPRPESAELEKW
jgi:lipopolysaccharide/colanic/teichoic acid biosynthesis glycosyltransferase